jgi:hypothetical protein
MAEWWQNPAYDARLAAGQVQTPGLVDWGGMASDLYNAFQAPYNERMDRESVGFDKSIPESAWQTTQSSRLTDFTPYRPMPSIPPGGLNGSYSAQPRIASTARSAAPSASRVAVAPGIGPYFEYPTSPYMGEQDRLPPSGGIDPVQRVAYNLPGGGNLPGSGFQYPAYTARPRTTSALDAIEKAVPGGPSFPLRGGGQLNGAPPNYGNYRASMKFASGGQDIPNLDSLGLDDMGAQRMADSRRGPVAANGRVYYPGGRAPATAGGAAPQRQGMSGGLGGLLGGLFGGGGLGGGNAFQRPAGTPAITAPGGGGAFVSSASSQPASSPLSGVGGENSLLPASLNSERWRTGY